MKDEYNALRYAIQTFSESSEVRIKGYQGLYKLCSDRVWYVYLDELNKNLRLDKISHHFENEPKFHKPLNLNKQSSSQGENIEKYFASLGTKNIQQETFKIKEYASLFYDSGNFSQYIMVFNRFITSLKNDLSESELHMFLVKYVIASIVKRQYDLAISEITKLKQHYHNYDISVYIFFLKIVQGKFHQAEEEILNITKNIYQEFFDKILNQETLAFYIIIIMLVCHKKHVILSIQTNSNCFAYKLMEMNPELFSVIENYSKCKFGLICSEFENLKTKISQDPIIEPFLYKANKSLKENILVQILKSSSSIPISYLTDVLKEDKATVVNMISLIIQGGQVNCRIDSVDQLVISVEPKIENTTFTKALENSQKSYATSVKKLIKLMGQKHCYLDRSVRNEFFAKHEGEEDQKKGFKNMELDDEMDEAYIN